MEIFKDVFVKLLCEFGMEREAFIEKTINYPGFIAKLVEGIMVALAPNRQKTIINL